VTLSFDVILGRGGVGDHLAAWTFMSGSLGALFSKSMTSFERGSGYVALKPTWKGNLGWLLLIAMIVSASIFVFVSK
jgi:hypothetical protein